MAVSPSNAADPAGDSSGGSSDDSKNREYYNAFAAGYEKHRGKNDPGGYHELLDELESDLVRRYATGRDVLEVGCGTGLVLQRIASFARSAKGVDLSEGMLEAAKQRGLDVTQGSATTLPFADDSFDVTCSFKVLAHIPDIEQALSEMVRVTRPDGIVLAEFYNRHSLRGLIKRYGPAGRIAANRRESDVFTRFDTPADVRGYLPANARLISSRGVRIAIPAAQVMRVPLLRDILRGFERRACDGPLSRFGGFWIAVLQKQS